ncbi:MAG: hypothetical protein KKH92_09805 [Firmicutes bacterium]|nr:hypothetical protein [Bacillota bacterium]
MFNNYLVYQKEWQTKLQLGDYFVLYIDVLGYKKLLKKDKDFLVKMKYLMSVIIKEHVDSYTLNAFKYKMFSDNVLICIKQNENKSLERLINFASRLQSMAMFHFGFFMRGSICRGSLYIDEDIVYGDALVKAFELESMFSKVPRIIIDKSLYDEKYVSTSNHRICMFDDNYKIVNYLHFYFAETLIDKSRENQLSEIYKYVQSNLLQTKGRCIFKNRTHKKILWVDKFNRYVLEKQEVLKYYK